MQKFWLGLELTYSSINNYYFQARATLNEPSRPITPASLEDRVGLIQSSLDRNGPPSSTGYSSSSSSFMYNGIRIGSSSVAPTANSKLSRKASGGDNSLLLLDVMDTVNLLEAEIQSMTQGVSTISQALHHMTLSVDKFAKYMKTNQYQENEGAQTHIFFIL